MTKEDEIRLIFEGAIKLRSTGMGRTSAVSESGLIFRLTVDEHDSMVQEKERAEALQRERAIDRLSAKL